MSRQEYGSEYLEVAGGAAVGVVDRLFNYWADPPSRGTAWVVRNFGHLREVGAVRIGVHTSPDSSGYMSLLDSTNDTTGATHIIIVIDPVRAYAALIEGNNEPLFLKMMYDVVTHYGALRGSGVSVPE